MIRELESRQNDRTLEPTRDPATWHDACFVGPATAVRNVALGVTMRSPSTMSRIVRCTIRARINTGILLI